MREGDDRSSISQSKWTFLKTILFAAVFLLSACGGEGGSETAETKVVEVSERVDEDNSLTAAPPKPVEVSEGEGAADTPTSPELPDEDNIQEVSSPPPVSDGEAVSVAIHPTPIILATGRSQTFTATVSGSDNVAVAWSVQEGDAGGTITAGGIYTAPHTKGIYHVVATSQADPARSATVAVAVLPAGITRVSISSQGVESNDDSSSPICTSYVSPDGRYVGFASQGSNLVEGDTNNREDSFLHDRITGETVRITVGTGGFQAEGGSSNSPWISNDLRYVIFTSFAQNLVPEDTNGSRDMFLRDRQTGTTTLVSVGLDGRSGNGVTGGSPQISGDGRYGVFNSYASNLVEGDTNEAADAFVRDLFGGRTFRVSVGYDGSQANDSTTGSPAISNNGRYVAFYSDASNLAPADSNGVRDLFVYDIQTGRTVLASVGYDGSPANNGTGGGPDANNPSSQLPSIPKNVPAISPDGRYVAFFSDASNLVEGDTNGMRDIFYRDLQDGVTYLVSIGLNGEPAVGVDDLVNGLSGGNPWISGDGRYVAFESRARNLVEEDTNDIMDIFVRDMQTGITKRLTVGFDGSEANGDSFYPLINLDSRWVAFSSDASNLVPNDTNADLANSIKGRDVFVAPLPFP